LWIVASLRVVLLVIASPLIEEIAEIGELHGVSCWTQTRPRLHERLQQVILLLLGWVPIILRAQLLRLRLVDWLLNEGRHRSYLLIQQCLARVTVQNHGRYISIAVEILLIFLQVWLFPYLLL
jgi:antibiotic biosynthesis monooxygenase (ABM) superfamily enzyme